MLGRSEGDNFTALKVAMATAPVLRLPDFERQFVVTTDASDVAVGAILEQDCGSGLQPIAFASRKLNATEIRYSEYEREIIRHRMGYWSVESLLPKPLPHYYSDGPRTTETPPKPNISKQQDLALALRTAGI